MGEERIQERKEYDTRISGQQGGANGIRKGQNWQDGQHRLWKRMHGGKQWMVEKTDQETAPAGVRCEGMIELRVLHLQLVRRLPLLLPLLLSPHNADTPAAPAPAAEPVPVPPPANGSQCAAVPAPANVIGGG